MKKVKIILLIGLAAAAFYYHKNDCSFCKKKQQPQIKANEQTPNEKTVDFNKIFALYFAKEGLIMSHNLSKDGSNYIKIIQKTNLIDASKYNLKTFCNQDCVLKQLNDVFYQIEAQEHKILPPNEKKMPHSLFLIKQVVGIRKSGETSFWVDSKINQIKKQIQQKNYTQAYNLIQNHPCKELVDSVKINLESLMQMENLIQEIDEKIQQLLLNYNFDEK